jgi:hypothetical protein
MKIIDTNKSIGLIMLLVVVLFFAIMFGAISLLFKTPLGLVILGIIIINRILKPKQTSTIYEQEYRSKSQSYGYGETDDNLKYRDFDEKTGTFSTGSKEEAIDRSEYEDVVDVEFKEFK